MLIRRFVGSIGQIYKLLLQIVFKLNVGMGNKPRNIRNKYEMVFQSCCAHV